jgi:membrane-associated phospholipid phosphatase
MMVVICGYARWRGFRQFQQLSLVVICAIATSNILSILIQCAGRSPAPLIDRDLARIDAALGFSTAAVVRLAAGFPRIRAALAIVYAAAPLLIAASLIVPVLCGRATAAYRYILATAIAAVLTALAFSLWPAAGPWTVEGFRAAPDQAAVTAYLGALKVPGPFALDFALSGVVSFPSFHVVLALLSATALWCVRPLRAVAAAFAAATCAATLTTGWHYGIDVVGGVAVAFTAQALAGRLLPAPVEARQ